ncbi:MAG: hypoxanthine phosphoribosyltransferase [Clostridia bacterium]|nr:hypoxanthine phosphoribosyltransferase [Clostridia bacterium]
MSIKDPIEKILITEEEIKKRVKELAKEIDRDYEGKEPLIVSVLSGSYMFTADIMREISLPLSVNFIYASSYGSGTASSGKVEIHGVKGFDPVGKDIIIVEDIIDSGRTLSEITKQLKECGANSVEICTFLDKPSRRVVDIKGKYTGFEIPDEFVVGYGLDYAYKYRQFPFVGVLKKEFCE